VLRRRYEGWLKGLDDSLRKMRPPPPPVDLWNVSGYEEVLDRAEGLIQAGEAERLGPALEAAARRKVKIVSFSFCALEDHPGRVFSYGLDEPDLEKFWKHKLILVVDHSRTLMGGAEPDEKSEAVVTGHPAITEVALNNIALDITLLSQRKKVDATESMIEMLGERLGSLDPLVSKKR
jgi:hypothetical protein